MLLPNIVQKDNDIEGIKLLCNTISSCKKKKKRERVEEGDE